MAGSVNKVILVGNLGRDPEVRTTQDGTKVVNFSLATSERWRDRQSGEQREVVPLLLRGGGDELLIVFTDEDKLQGVEVGVEGIEVDFGRSFHDFFSGSRWRS